MLLRLTNKLLIIPARVPLIEKLTSPKEPTKKPQRTIPRHANVARDDS